MYGVKHIKVYVQVAYGILLTEGNLHIYFCMNELLCTNRHF